ncbi:hypothetical protein, partial [Dietzia psychralcaliphila]
MKNTKRMIAVIAASGLALGSMPGVANAQSAGLNLDLGTALGSSGPDASLGGLGLDLGLALGSTGPDGLLAGSDAGSDDLFTGSD